MHARTLRPQGGGGYIALSSDKRTGYGAPPDASGGSMHEAAANLQTLSQISKHFSNFFTHVHADSDKAGGKAHKASRRFGRFGGSG